MDDFLLDVDLGGFGTASVIHRPRPRPRPRPRAQTHAHQRKRNPSPSDVARAGAQSGAGSLLKPARESLGSQGSDDAQTHHSFYSNASSSAAESQPGTLRPLSSLRSVRSFTDIARYFAGGNSGRSSPASSSTGERVRGTKGAKEGEGSATSTPPGTPFGFGDTHGRQNDNRRVFSSRNPVTAPDLPGEVTKTPYGPGRIQARRWDGIIEVKLRIGMAYLHEIHGFHENHEAYRRSTDVVTPFGNGEVVGGRANGIVKVQLGYAIAYMDQSLARFDLPEQLESFTANSSSDKQRSLQTNTELKKAAYHPLPKKREKRVRSLLNGMLLQKRHPPEASSGVQGKGESKMKDDVRPGSRSSWWGGSTRNVDPHASGANGWQNPASGTPRKDDVTEDKTTDETEEEYDDDALNRITKALTGESIVSNIETFLKKAAEISDDSDEVSKALVSRALRLKQEAEKALARDDVYRSLSSTVQHVGALVQSLGVHVENISHTGEAALDEVQTIMDSIIDNVSSEQAADATSKFLENSVNTATSTLADTSPGGSYGIDSSHANDEKHSQSSEKPDAKIQIGIGSLVKAEKTKPVIEELFKGLKDGLKKQHQLIQKTARNLLKSKALKTSVETLVSGSENDSTIMEFARKGISALTGFTEGSEGVEKLSQEQIDELNSELLATVSLMVGTPANEGKDCSKGQEGNDGKTPNQELTPEKLEALREQLAIQIQSQCQRWGPGSQRAIKKAISVLNDRDKYLEWLKMWVKPVLKRTKNLKEGAFMQTIRMLSIDFLRSYLPRIKFGPIKGLSEGGEWQYKIIGLTLEGLKMRRDRVKSEFVGRELKVKVWDLECDIQNLGWEFQQCRFPYVSAKGTADAKVRGLSFSLCLALVDAKGIESNDEKSSIEPSSTAEHPLFELRDKELVIDNLTLDVNTGGSWTSWFANTITWMFADIIRRYIVSQIDYVVDVQIGGLVETVNSMANDYRPLLVSILKSTASSPRCDSTSGSHATAPPKPLGVLPTTEQKSEKHIREANGDKVCTQPYTKKKEKVKRDRNSCGIMFMDALQRGQEDGNRGASNWSPKDRHESKTSRVETADGKSRSKVTASKSPIKVDPRQKIYNKVVVDPVSPSLINSSYSSHVFGGEEQMRETRQREDAHRNLDRANEDSTTGSYISGFLTPTSLLAEDSALIM